MIVTEVKIEKMIYLIRGQKIMLDYDLALLYDVETRTFNQAVKRNSKRFPKDFMFQLTSVEYESLRSQFVISKKDGRGGRRYLPFVFTEQGVAMLTSVLNSERAIEVNISIMRSFVKLRKVLGSDQTLADKIHDLEKGTTKLFRIVFERLDMLEAELPLMPKKRKKIGLNRKE